MNLFDLSDKDRIRILKAVIVLEVAALATNMYFFKKTYDEFMRFTKKHSCNVRKMRVAAKIIERLMKDADPDLIKEIVDKFEFDWLIAEIDPDEVRVEDYDDPEL